MAGGFYASISLAKAKHRTKGSIKKKVSQLCLGE